jgi:hypothetical protein
MPTYRTSWNGAIIAESERTIRDRANQYFPSESLTRELLTDSPTTSRCPWKGSETTSAHSIAARLWVGADLDMLPKEITLGAVSDDVLDEPDRRAATEELMRALRTGRWTPVAWSRFLARATR